MGKTRIPENVNLQTSTIGNKLKQIRRTNLLNCDSEMPSLLDVWVCNIHPNQTKTVLDFIQNHIRVIDETDYTHIKRFRKKETTEGVLIGTVICSASLLSFPEMMHLLRSSFSSGFEESNLEVQAIPSQLPHTKELAMHWSSLYWPLSWKGNPNHQDLITARFDLEDEGQIIQDLIIFAGGSKSLPVATIVAERDEGTGKLHILHRIQDNRTCDPLNHSIMEAIASVAQKEKESRCAHQNNTEKSYLCQNLLFYTTHEPCVMCAMALVHSRIDQLVYIFDHPAGGIETSHFVGDRRDLNWTFDIWKWVGPVQSPNLEISCDDFP